MILINGFKLVTILPDAPLDPKLIHSNEIWAETKQQIWHCLRSPALLLYFVCVNPIIGSFLYMYDSDQQMILTLLKNEIFTFSPGSAGAPQHSLFPPGLPAENDHNKYIL